MSTRREFLKSSGAIAVAGATVTAGVGESRDARAAESDSAGMLLTRPEHPEPASYDRMPLEWHQRQVRRLQQQLGERGLDGILITDRWNLIYYTGLFHTSTERPFSCFIPTDELA